MKIEDCNVGNLVIMWCVGWDTWDDEVLKVVDTFGLTVKLESKSGRTQEVYHGAQCKVVSF
jgi:hypothetical protein